jgi:hypothetical protein
MNLIDANIDLDKYTRSFFLDSYIHLMDGGLGNQLLQVGSISSLIRNSGQTIILDFLDQSENYYYFNPNGIPAISQLNLPSNFYILYSSISTGGGGVVDKAVLRKKIHGRGRRLLHVDKLNFNTSISLDNFIGVGWKSENELEITQFCETILKLNMLKIPINREYSIGIHLRAGDYSTHPELGKLNVKYFLEALSRIKEFPSNIFIYSDSRKDAEKLQKLIESKYKKIKILISSENDPSRTMFAIASHEILILSNSTLSWWAARLSKSKMIFCPHPWYISKSIFLSIPTNWTKIKRSNFNYWSNYVLSSIKYRRIRN